MQGIKIVNRLKVMGFVLCAIFCFKLACAQTIQLAVTKNPVVPQKIISAPAYIGAGVAATAAFYCSSFSVWFKQWYGIPPGATLSRHIANSLDFLQGQILSEKILKIPADDKVAQQASTIYWSCDRSIYLGIHFLQLYAIYKAGAVTKRLTHLFVNRNTWTMQLTGGIQEQIKMIALLRTTKHELEQLANKVKNPDLQAMIIASGSRNVDRLIQNYTKKLSITLKAVSELNNDYQKIPGYQLFNQELEQGILAANQDFIALTYGGVLNQQDLCVLVQEDPILSKTVDRLLEAEDIVAQKDDAAGWRGARKAQEAVHLLYQRAEQVLNEQQKAISEALIQCNRLLWWRSRASSLPFMR